MGGLERLKSTTIKQDQVLVEDTQLRINLINSMGKLAENNTSVIKLHSSLS